MTSPKTMPFEDIELAYECLAEAVDRAGSANEALFLAKLALALGQQLGSVAPFKVAIEMALQDLPDVVVDTKTRKTAPRPTREVRLAAALRGNLQKRKAATRRSPPEQAGADHKPPGAGD